MSADAAQRVLDLYYIAYYKTNENGQVQYKDGKPIDNTSEIKRAIEGALKNYRAKTGRATGSIDPRGFREYVESTSSQPERDALKYMNRLRNLFNEILPKDPSSRKGIGLTPVEARISRSVLLGSLQVREAQPKELEEAILTETSRPVLLRPQAVPTVRPT